MYREGVDKRSMLIRMVAVLKMEAGFIYIISLPNFTQIPILSLSTLPNFQFLSDLFLYESKNPFLGKSKKKKNSKNPVVILTVKAPQKSTVYFENLSCLLLVNLFTSFTTCCCFLFLGVFTNSLFLMSGIPNVMARNIT